MAIDTFAGLRANGRLVQMRVSLLGPVLARTNDGDVDLGGTKQRAVFALLALQAGRVVPMDRLIDDLWHEDPPAQATVTLRAYISRLRRALEAVRADHETQPVEIRTQPPGWILEIPRADVDLIDFHERLARVRALLSANEQQMNAADLRDCCDQLVAALGLWRGDPLADLRLLGVAGEEATRAQDARAAAVELLLETRLRLGQHERVAEDAQPFVDDNPFRERAWAALVLALYRSGRQSDAVAAVARLRQLLQDELGLDPSPAIQALEMQVLRQDPALLPARERTALEVPGAHIVAPQTPADPDQPIRGPLVVGYQQIVQQIEAALAASKRGQGALLVLDAEAGAGKTTLLQLLARAAEAGGGRVVHAGGGGAGAMPALWPWVTVVRAISSGDAGPAAPDSLVDPASIATAHALMLASPGDRSAAPAELTLSRTALYRGVIELLAIAHRQAPITVVFDDLQWVDDETVTLLSLAVDELSPQGVLFAAAMRTDEPSAQRVLSALIRTPRHLLNRVHLDGLDPDAVAELVSRATGEPADEEVVAALHAATAGNPLFVTELVRLLAAERRLDPEGVLTTLPERVHDVLRRRIERLPSASIALMQIIALARSPVDVELLAAVTGQDTDQVLDDVEAALITGLLLERPGEAGIRPSHDLVRQVLVAGLSGVRRLRLHARIAAALQARGQFGPEGILEVAHHLAAAAPAVGTAAAIPYLLTAAEDALSRYATRSAGRILEEALALANQITDPLARSEAEHRVRGRLDLIRAYGGSDAALPSAAMRPLPPLTDANLTSWVGTLTMAGGAGELTWVREMAQAALAGPLSPWAQTAAHQIVGWTSFVLGEIEIAKLSLERVLELVGEWTTGATSGPLRPSREASIGYLALIAHLEGDEATASAILQSAFQAPEDDTGLVNLELHACFLASMRADAKAARTHASRMIRLAERLEYNVLAAHGRIFHSWATAVLDDHPGAAELEAALSAYRSSGFVVFEPTFDVLLAEVHLLAGDPAEARSAAALARTVTARTGEVIHGSRLNLLAHQLTSDLT